MYNFFFNDILYHEPKKCLIIKYQYISRYVKLHFKLPTRPFRYPKFERKWFEKFEPLLFFLYLRINLLPHSDFGRR